MTEPKQQLIEKIRKAITSGHSARDVARRLYLYDFASVFRDEQERGFDIINAISKKFNLPFSSIKIVGSAQTGYSYISGRDFRRGESDLDIAIVDGEFFKKCSENVYLFTKAYTDLSMFPWINGVNTENGFRMYLSKGYFRPDYMPGCQAKSDWLSFFNRLSSLHTDLFKSINAGIYLSEVFFEVKQGRVVKAYREIKQ